MSTGTGNRAAVLSTLVLILLLAVELPGRGALASRKIGNKRRDKPTGSGPGAIPNMCAKDIDMKLGCHCTVDEETRRNTVDADCLILHDDFPQSDVAWSSFRQHPQLRHVALTVHRNGFMGYLPSAVLGAQRELRSIQITYAEIREIPPFAFGNLTRLENVTLTHNHIEVLEQQAFVNHPQLRWLSLEENEIVAVDAMAFANLPQLQELVLAKNNISVLHDAMFVELEALHTLRLNENIVAELRRMVFRGLGNLRTLDLSYNEVRRLEDGVFEELWSLEVLDLSSNGMEHLSERALNGLGSLHSLVLRNNRLRTLEAGVFSGVPSLNLLELSSNHLETLPFNAVLPMMENLINSTMHVLVISDNKFICDCRLTWMFDVRNRTKNFNLRNTLEKVACQLQSTTNTGNDDDPTATNAVVHHFAPVQRQRWQHQQQQQQPQQYREHSFGGHQQQQHQHQQHPYLEDTSGENDLTHPQHKQHHQHHHKTTAHGFDMAVGGSGGAGELTAAGITSSSGSSSNIHHQHHHLVNLMQLGVERLPCPGELAGPTELPLSRESIAGLDLRWLSSGGAAARTTTTTTATMSIAMTVAGLVLATAMLNGGIVGSAHLV